MSRVCQLTGRKPLKGNHVSHSNRKTKRVFAPNLHNKRFFIPETGEWIHLRICSTALRTINKLGIFAYLKKLEKQGKISGV